jgi:NAD(P)-dependent dehydrogenase (short-subunit alcohol dehydrogenase family)
MARLVGKRVIMTGAVSNIGRAAAELMVAEGATVVVGDIDIEAGRELEATVRGVTFVKCDVTQEADIRSLVEMGVAVMGGLDGLCQNAGVQPVGGIEVLDGDVWDRTFAVNVRAQFFGAKHAVPHLRRSGDAAIINTASTAGFRAGPGSTIYGASKGAVINFSKTLAVELAPHGIRVNAICPGWVDTPFNRQSVANMGGKDAQTRSVETFVPMRRQGTPAEIAPAFVYLLSEEASYVTGQALVLDGGLSG